MPYPPVYRPSRDFALDQAAGREFDATALQAELGRIAASLMGVRDHIRKLSTADAQFQPAAAEATTIDDRFAYTATPAQTVFAFPTTRTPAPTFVRVFIDGALFNPALVTPSTTGVTLAPPLPLVGGELVVVEVFDSVDNLLGILGSTAHAMGASLVGVEDADGLLSGAQDVEDALRVLAGSIDDINDLLSGGTSEAILRDGTKSMLADLSLAGFKVINLLAGVNPTDAVNRAQLDAVAAAVSGFLPLAGGTMTGAINHGGQRAMGVGNATDPLDAPNLGQTQAFIAAGDAALDARIDVLEAALVGAGSQLITTPGAGAFVVPAGVTRLQVTLRGAGGAGGRGTNYNTLGGGGGGGGSGETVQVRLSVTPAQVLNYVVGAGSTASQSAPGAGNNGNNGTNPDPINNTVAASTTFGALAARGGGNAGPGWYFDDGMSQVEHGGTGGASFGGFGAPGVGAAGTTGGGTAGDGGVGGLPANAPGWPVAVAGTGSIGVSNGSTAPGGAGTFGAGGGGTGDSGSGDTAGVGGAGGAGWILLEW